MILRLRDAADESTAPLEECRRRARLDDPDIAKMHVCGEHGRFVYTVVSEPLGDSLSEVMHEGRLSRPQVDRIFRKVREAWNRACEQGVTLGASPGNIILREEDGLPVLTGLDLRMGAASEPAPPALAFWGERSDDSPADPLEGSAIGGYLLRRKIGEGGFGVVYSALQTGELKRQVALKIIKVGMDTRQVMARFEMERQALALMDHPNIAQVFDAGETEGGRPYFVMELVKEGIAVSDYCVRENLDTEGRLLLFMQICQGVQHAHIKGILHRDLKPSNVLVTCQEEQPLAKVIDFGLAKAMHQDLRLDPTWQLARMGCFAMLANHLEQLHMNHTQAGDSPSPHYYLALAAMAHLMGGDLEDYARVSQSLLLHLQSLRDLEVCKERSEVSLEAVYPVIPLLHECSELDLRSAIAEALRLRKSSDSTSHWTSLARTLAFYRANNLQAALAELNSWDWIEPFMAGEMDGELSSTNLSALFLSALVVSGLGDTKTAASRLKRGWRRMEFLISRRQHADSEWASFVTPSVLAVEARRKILNENLPYDYFWRNWERTASLPQSAQALIERGATWKFYHPEDGVDPACRDEDGCDRKLMCQTAN